MKKKFLAAAVAAAALSLGVLSGCGAMTKSIYSIQKTDTDGLVDTYTITYTDGTTYTYTVTNGKDGESGKDSGVSVKSIDKTSTVGLVDYYTVTMTDGTTSTFTVTNGKDGESAAALTVNDVYEAYKAQYGEGLTFEQFCSLYLSVDVTDTVQSINSCLLSSMKVYTAFTKTTTSGGWYGPSTTTTSHTMSSGSAVIYRMESDYTYILTNYHVVYSSGTNELISKEINAYLYGSEAKPVETGSGYTYGKYAIPCEYVGGTIEYDVALIRAKTEDVRAINSQAKPVTIAESYEVGESVFAIGNTAGKGIEVTQGIVSVDREYITLAIDNTSRQYLSMRTDAMIYEGNSGGGLFNAKGEMIGLNHAGDTSLTFLNNAIPCQTFSAVADGIMYYKTAESSLKSTKKLYLGVTVTSENSRFVYNAGTGKGEIVETLKLSSVNGGSAAASLGFIENDVITGMILNGKQYTLNRMYQLGDVFLNVRAGDKISFSYTRGGESKSTGEYTVSAEWLKSVA